MDSYLTALISYKNRKYEECAAVCTKILNREPHDQAAWVLKMRALNASARVDELEVDLGEAPGSEFSEAAIASLPRPGTSLQNPSSNPALNQELRSNVNMSDDRTLRPTDPSGRPLSAYVRPATSSGAASGGGRLRTAHTARPAGTATGRFIRLGTASMVAGEGEFISALELAAFASESCKFSDWWWKLAIAKCYTRIGLHREAEKQLQSAIRLVEEGSSSAAAVSTPRSAGGSGGNGPPHIQLFVWLARCYLRLDQPLNAIQVFVQYILPVVLKRCGDSCCKEQCNAELLLCCVQTCQKGLELHPNDPQLLKTLARIHEDMRNVTEANEYYKRALQSDAMCVEALATIAMNHFYGGQPELALHLYKRLLLIGIQGSAELFCNMGVCCYYAQQYPQCLRCFERALSLADSDRVRADVWYNVAIISIALGDLNQAYQCLRLALSLQNEHAESYNQLAALELHRGNAELARAFLLAATATAPHLLEAHANLAVLSEQLGDLQTSYQSVRRALQIAPAHARCRQLHGILSEYFYTV